MTDDGERMRAVDARDALLALLGARAAGATVCPSEVARALSAKNWRDRMPVVHAAVDALVAEGRIALSWKGQALPERRGPYRIARV